MIECPECKKQISSKAPACPSCGARRGSHPIAKIFLLLVGIGVGVIVIAMENRRARNPAAQARQHEVEALEWLRDTSTRPFSFRWCMDVLTE